MQMLGKHFDIAFAASDGIKKLRELILTLAMQGKLVPQDPKDQPARELLQEVAAEKKLLVRDRKIKAPKPMPEIRANEVPYALPVGWEWVRLGEIGLIGSSSRVHQKDWRASGVPFYRAREIVKLSKNGFVDNDLFIAEELFESLTASGLVPTSGDIMITGVGTIGIPYVVKENDRFYFKDASVLIFKNFFKIFPFYLLHLFRSQLWNNSIHEESMGTTVHTLTIVRANEILIPLPPLAEQRRIVAKIDQLMARCDELEKLRAERDQKRFTVHAAAINQLLTSADINDFSNAWRFITQHFAELYSVNENVAELRKAILQLAVMGKLVPQDPHDQTAGEILKEIAAEKKRLVKEGKIKATKPLPDINSEDVPYGLPSGWTWVRLGTCLLKITDGTHHSPPNVETGDYLYISAKNIKDDGVLLTNATYVTSKVHKEIFSRCDPEYGDILYIKDGATTGIVTINNLKEPFSMLSSVALLKQPRQIDNKYLLFALRSPLFYHEMRSGMTGVAITRVTLQKLNNAIIPLPPLAEQRRIVSRIDQLMVLCDELDRYIIKCQGLADRLMNATVADATGMQKIGGVMVANTKDEKFKAGSDDEILLASDLPREKQSIKNFTLRKFSMSTGYRSLLTLDCLFHGDVRLVSEVSPVCLVGLNGSGKSNLIEAIADVFCFLELINLPWKKIATDSSKYKKNDHFFELEYDIETNDGFHEVVIKKNKKNGVEFYLRGESDILIPVLPGIEQLKLLPRRVIGYSSGLNETVSHPFLRTKTLYSEEVRDAAPKPGAPMSNSKSVIDTRTLYMDYESNAAILICNYIFKTQAELSVINDYTRVNGVSSFNLRFNKKRTGRSADSRIVRLTLELESALKSFLRCAEKESQFSPDKEEYELEFNLDEKTASRFREEFSNAEALFMAMHKWSLLNALVLSDAQRTVFLKEDITKGTLERPPSVPPKDRIFNIADLKLNLSTPAITIDYSGLSDGEHQFIQVFGTVMLFNEPGSLFLFDEPESHFNPEWRTRFNVILNSLPNAKLHEFMISTHSPFLVSGSRGCNVFKFERNGANVGCKPVDFETYGASFDYLLNKLFGIESMIDQNARAELEEIIRGGNKEAMENALGDFAESREKRRLYQALIEKEEGVK